MLKAISLALYLVAFGIAIWTTRWALELMAPDLSHSVKIALTIPPCIFIMATWPLPLPFWMTYDWVLHGKTGNQAK